MPDSEKRKRQALQERFFLEELERNGPMTTTSLIRASLHTPVVMTETDTVRRTAARLLELGLIRKKLGTTGPIGHARGAKKTKKWPCFVYLLTPRGREHLASLRAPAEPPPGEIPSADR